MCINFHFSPPENISHSLTAASYRFSLLRNFEINFNERKDTRKTRANGASLTGLAFP